MKVPFWSVTHNLETGHLGPSDIIKLLPQVHWKHMAPSSTCSYSGCDVIKLRSLQSNSKLIIQMHFPSILVWSCYNFSFRLQLHQECNITQELIAAMIQHKLVHGDSQYDLDIVNHCLCPFFLFLIIPQLLISFTILRITRGKLINVVDRRGDQDGSRMVVGQVADEGSRASPRTASPVKPVSSLVLQMMQM